MPHPPWPGVRILGLLAALGLAACETPIKTDHDFDPSAKLHEFRTYSWISPDPLMEPQPGTSGTRYVSPIDEQRIRRAVDLQLSEKGYERRPLASADLVVSFTIGSEERVSIQETPGMGRMYTRPYGYGSWYGESTVRVKTYTQGTLAVEFFDRTTKQAVWVGWGSKRLSERDDPDEKINRAVALILAPFPARRAAD